MITEQEYKNLSIKEFIKAGLKVQKLEIGINTIFKALRASNQFGMPEPIIHTFTDFILIFRFNQFRN